MTARTHREPTFPHADDARPTPLRSQVIGESFSPTGLLVRPDPVTDAKARRVVLRRYAMGATADATYEWLAMLGLLPETPEPAELPGDPTPETTAAIRALQPPQGPPAVHGHHPDPVRRSTALSDGRNRLSETTSTRPKDAA